MFMQGNEGMLVFETYFATIWLHIYTCICFWGGIEGLNWSPVGRLFISHFNSLFLIPFTSVHSKSKHDLWQAKFLYITKIVSKVVLLTSKSHKIYFWQFSIVIKQENRAFLILPSSSVTAEASLTARMTSPCQLRWWRYMLVMMMMVMVVRQRGWGTTSCTTRPTVTNTIEINPDAFISYYSISTLILSFDRDIYLRCWLSFCSFEVRSGSINAGQTSNLEPNSANKNSSEMIF